MDSTESPQRMRLRRLRRPWVIVAALCAALAISVPVAWATFFDVPPSNPFYADVNAIQGAGITQGCGGGNFCPLDSIQRQAEAAFVHRGMPRVAQQTVLSSTTVVDTDDNKDIASVTIVVPGVPGGQQFVKLDASVNVFGTNAGCPCLFGLGIDDVPGSIFGDSRTFYQWTVSGYNQPTMTVSHVYPASSGTHTYYLSISTESTVAASLRSLRFIASTATFGSTGTTTLAEGSAASSTHTDINGRPT
jgi:hypothetical protein